MHAQVLIKINEDFLSHLMQDNFELERLAYYKTIDFSAPSYIPLTKDIVYLSSKYNDTLLLNKYAFFTKDTNDLILVFYGAVVLNSNKIYTHILQELTLKKIAESKIAQLSELIDFIEGRVNSKTNSIQFYTTSERIKKLQQKSLFIATLLSIIVPGTGKYYLMQNGEATGTIFLNLLASAPVIESIIKIGLISTGTLITGLVFLPVYMANIYGTVISKKILLKKLNTQLKNEVLDYCNYQLRN
jgi:hypothetical protein